MYYGYHRTSTEEQHLDRGIKAIRDYCSANNIVLQELFTDQQTGKNFNRPDYITLKRIAKNKGDVIIITEIDRLGRNKEDTLKELRDFKDRGVRVMILELPTTLVDYSAMGNDLASMMMETVNNMLVEMYATLAHAEMIKRVTRQREGIEAKKARGEWENYGRPAILQSDKEIKDFWEAYKLLCSKDEPMPKTKMMEKLKMSKASFYRYRKMCLEKEFPIMYVRLLRGEITMNNIMNNLGLQEEEYNRYVTDFGRDVSSIQPNPAPIKQPAQANVYTTPTAIDAPQAVGFGTIASSPTLPPNTAYCMAFATEITDLSYQFEDNQEVQDSINEWATYANYIIASGDTLTDEEKEKCDNFLAELKAILPKRVA